MMELKQSLKIIGVKDPSQLHKDSLFHDSTYSLPKLKPHLKEKMVHVDPGLVFPDRL